MSTANTGWLKDNNGEKFAPKTLSSQVITESGETLNSVLDNLDDVNKMGDFIVEEATSGEWTFRRWNNGYLECWCSEQVTIAANPTAWGNSYIIKGSAIDYPFEFARRPAQSISLYTADGSYWVIPNYNTTTSTGTYYCARPTTMSTAVTGVVSFIVKGSLV